MVEHDQVWRIYTALGGKENTNCKSYPPLLHLGHGAIHSLMPTIEFKKVGFGHQHHAFMSDQFHVLFGQYRIMVGCINVICENKFLADFGLALIHQDPFNCAAPDNDCNRSLCDFAQTALFISGYLDNLYFIARDDQNCTYNLYTLNPEINALPLELDRVARALRKKKESVKKIHPFKAMVRSDKGLEVLTSSK